MVVTAPTEHADLHGKSAASDNNCSANLRDSFFQRLKERTEKGGDEDCWPVRGAAGNPYGHVNLAVRKVRRYAHRVAWEAANGPIPAGKVICHTCDNPRCVNPNHLCVGTQADNVHDAVNKGRKKAWGLQKIDRATVLDIYARRRAGQLQKDIARVHGLSRNHVSSILNGKCWRHLHATQCAAYLPSSATQQSGVRHQ